jgi:hypothetical protein
VTIVSKILQKMGVLPPPHDTIAQVQAKDDLRAVVHEYRNMAQQSVVASRKANRASLEALKTAENAIRMLEEARAVGDIQQHDTF